MTDGVAAAAQADVEVRFRGVATGGAAVGRVTGPEDSPHVGMTAFVPFAAPGEAATVRVSRLHARYLDGELVSLQEASPERAKPRCPYFGTCGGCDLQHMTYAAQLSAKRDMVVGALRTALGGPEAADALVAPVTSGLPYGYRRRVTLHLGPDGSMGYYRRRSHDLLPVKTCPISVEPIDALLGSDFTLEGLLPQGIRAELALEAGENGLFGVLRADRPLRVADVNTLVERMRAHFAGGAVEAGGGIVAQFGEETVLRRIAADVAVMHATPGIFGQVNAAVNEALVEAVCAVARDTGAQTAYDLYAGAGNFALPLAAMGLRAVAAVESAPALAASGRAEAQRRGLADRLTFVENTVERFLARRERRGERGAAGLDADLIVADPPRAGLGRLTSRFDFGRDLLLISCDLASAARDLTALKSGGWRVARVTPFDMFAQTAHVELLTHLRR
jgi:SAM-dependent methyltransferases related to tRNA (uracil-5-)-methyltransferase